MKMSCFNLSENWDLKKDEWKQDVIPEIWEGKNIADFIDPEIMEVSWCCHSYSIRNTPNSASSTAILTKEVLELFLNRWFDKDIVELVQACCHETFHSLQN